MKKQNNYDFNIDLKFSMDCHNDLLDYYKTKYNCEPYLCMGELQTKWCIDVLVMKNDSIYAIEEKFDRTKSKNFFIETWSCSVKNRMNRSSFYKSKANIFLYAFVDKKEKIYKIFTFSRKNFQDWFFKKENGKYFERKVLNNMQRTIGYLIPIREIIYNSDLKLFFTFEIYKAKTQELITEDFYLRKELEYYG